MNSRSLCSPFRVLLSQRREQLVSCLLHSLLHPRAVEALLALDAVLVRERAVRLDDALRGDARLALERVDVLREACIEEAVVREEKASLRIRRSELAFWFCGVSLTASKGDSSESSEADIVGVR